MELSNTTGIVTGASRGIGVFIAEALADKGVSLALAARSADDLAHTAERITGRGIKAIAIPTDVTKREDLESLVERTTRELGPVDLLINNAGVEMVGYFERLDPDGIERAIHVNLTSLIFLTRLVVPSRIERGRGHVCNIASAAGKAARPYGSVYSATKHGVVGFSWSLRAELGTSGVEVSVVCPSYVSDVGMFARRDAGKPPRALATCTPEEVARQVVKSIETNRAEVVVGSPIVRLSDVVHALSPDLAISIGKRGPYRFLKREATGSE